MLALLLIGGEFAKLMKAHTIELRGIEPVLWVLVDGVGTNRCGIPFEDETGGGAVTFGVRNNSGDIDFEVSTEHKLYSMKCVLTKWRRIHALRLSRK